MISEVAAEHAQRITTLSQALRAVHDGLAFLKSTNEKVDKIDAVQAALTKARDDILGNHWAAK